MNQLQAEYCSMNKVTPDDNRFWEDKQASVEDGNIQKICLKTAQHLPDSSSGNALNSSKALVLIFCITNIVGIV